MEHIGVRDIRTQRGVEMNLDILKEISLLIIGIVFGVWLCLYEIKPSLYAEDTVSEQELDKTSEESSEESEPSQDELEEGCE
jgi:hypothetical protein